MKKGLVPIKHPATGKLAVVWKRLVDVATALPGVEEGRTYGTPALRVKGKFMARLRTEAEGGLAIRCDLLQREMLIQADRETFYITDHYLNHPIVLVNLTKVDWDAVPGLVEQAWRLSATKTAVKKFDSNS